MGFFSDTWRVGRVVLAVTCSGWLTCSGWVHADEPDLPVFQRHQLSDRYDSEGAAVGDFNNDGKPDVVSGPFYYAGPDFKSRHEIFPPRDFPNDRGYSDNFFSFVWDVDGDDWQDIIVVGLPGTPAYWYQNSGMKDIHWKRHEVFPAVDNESPAFQDITGDGRPEIICSFGGKLGYVSLPDAPSTKTWTFHPISEPGPWQRFTHGLGVGDVDGDGKLDFLTARGWWRQPDSLENDPVWEAHPFAFSAKRGGAQMFAYDIDGDGDQDVITSLDAHGWGLNWYEQTREDGKITFQPHVIMGEKASESPARIAFSQLHAMDLADVDGDGLKDLVSGKCYWAHNGADPGARDPAVVYAFLLRRTDAGVTFLPVQLDADSGVGRQVTATDLDGDGRMDVVAANKKGVYVFRQK